MFASLAAWALAATAALQGMPDRPAITVSAAVSLKEALSDIARAYERETNHKVQLNFGATGQLLAQIREGAPVDIFISAADAQKAPDHATPHRKKDGKVEARSWQDIDNIAPAGAMVSTVRDLTQWLRFQLGDGTGAISVLAAGEAPIAGTCMELNGVVRSNDSGYVLEEKSRKVR